MSPSARFQMKKFAVALKINQHRDHEANERVAQDSDKAHSDLQEKRRCINPLEPSVRYIGQQSCPQLF